MRNILLSLLISCMLVFASCTPQNQPVSLVQSGTTQDESKLRKSKKPIKDSYIVVLNDNADIDAFASRHKLKVKKVFKRALKGLHMKMTAAEAEEMSKDPAVKYVEEDGRTEPADVQSSAPWNLDRIDQRAFPLDSNYTYSYTGEGVTAYIFDSGINTAHAEFEGRARFGFDYFNEGGKDCTGHGTHVAGTVGGKTAGVAKRVSLVTVRIADCAGYGSVGAMITGVNWVLENKRGPSVANMSYILSGGSSSLDIAITNGVNQGLVFVVASGNWSSDACAYSPGRTPAAITVGATAGDDSWAPYSNFGTCVDIHAPGSGILSAAHGDNVSMRYMTGTSMASPHVAGAAALYLQSNPSANAYTVFNALKANATMNALSNVPVGEPNNLLHINFGTAPDTGQTPAPTATPVRTPTPAPVKTPCSPPNSKKCRGY